MKIDFNKWWNNYDRAAMATKNKVHRFVDREVKWAMKHGYDSFVISYSDYVDERKIFTEYLTELGLIIVHINPYPFCEIEVKIPKREE